MIISSKIPKITFIVITVLETFQPRRMSDNEFNLILRKIGHGLKREMSKNKKKIELILIDLGISINIGVQVKTLLMIGVSIPLF